MNLRQLLDIFTVPDRPAMAASGPVPDVMTGLLEAELESLLRHVFLLLDPPSLKACRQVSSQWNSFILDRSGEWEEVDKVVSITSSLFSVLSNSILFLLQV